MKSLFTFLLILLLNILSFSESHTINYRIYVRHLGDSTKVLVTSGSVSEGQYITFPPFTLTGDIEDYQNLYDVVKGSTIYFEEESLAEDITVYFNVMSFDTRRAGFYFDHNLFFHMGVEVIGSRTGYHGFDDNYELQNGRYAVFKIPKDDDLRTVLNQINLDIADIDFAYNTRNGYDPNGIDYTEEEDSLKCRLLHFSKFAGGRGSVLPVELIFFSSEVEGNNVNLKWQTATEVNNYGFEIERAIVISTPIYQGKDLNWNKIGFVEGSGTSNSPKEYFFNDVITQSGKYLYRLKQVDIDGSYKYSDVVEVNIDTPQNFELGQNYPNPFNPSTTIHYTIPSDKTLYEKSLHVNLKIYDVLGREIATLVNEKQLPGNYSVKFDANKLKSGIYFYTLRAGNFVATKKMILIK